MHHDHVNDALTNPSDAELVVLACAGERAAFSLLIERHYGRALALGRRVLGEPHLAEDIAQEAVLSALVHLERLREPARFGPWLLAITGNLARMALRRRQALSLDALDEAESMTTIWSADLPHPEEVAALRELHDTIVAALAELSPLSREAVIGFYLQGYSYAELAALLNVPVGALKGRLVYGRRRLRERLNAYRPSQRWKDGSRAASTTLEEIPMSESALIPMTIDSIRMSGPARHRMVVLHSAEQARYLPIWIGPFEADAILHALEGVALPRPMTHDLTLRLLEPLGAAIRQVTISLLRDNTFFAEIELAVGEQVHRIDARPSDALALAARAGSPILVDQSVLDQAGVAELSHEIQIADAFTPEPVRMLVFSVNPTLYAELKGELARVIQSVVFLPPAADVEQLVRLARAQTFSVAFVALDHGSDAALEPVRRLRAEISQLPILVLGPDNEETEQHVRAAADNVHVAYMARPFNPAALHQALMQAM